MQRMSKKKKKKKKKKAATTGVRFSDRAGSPHMGDPT